MISEKGIKTITETVKMLCRDGWTLENSINMTLEAFNLNEITNTNNTIDTLYSIPHIDNIPTYDLKPIKIYEVWMEGYIYTWDSSNAQYLGHTVAKSFREACDMICKNMGGYRAEDENVCGCKLYENEKDARKNFG